MCKNVYLYFVGVVTYTFDGFEKSVKETGKTIDKGFQKVTMRKSKPSKEGIEKKSK